MMSELDDLAAQAEAFERVGAAPADGSPPPPPPEPPEEACVKEIAGILGAARGIAKARKFPRVATVLDDEVIEQFSRGLAPVLVKYDIRPAAFFGQWEAEIMAVLVCGPVLWSIVQAFRDDWEWKAAQAAKEVAKDTASEPGKS